jgi:hypothetical protein
MMFKKDYRVVVEWAQDGTPYYQQYQRMKDEVVKLNNALIAHLKGGRK